jgi:hypothetical protein
MMSASFGGGGGSGIFGAGLASGGEGKGINAHIINLMGTSLTSFKLGGPVEPMEIVYEPESYGKAKEVKKQMDDVLDDLNGLFIHVLQREAMKIQQKTNPQLNHARQKILSQEKRVRDLENMDTEQHHELRDLKRGIFEYGEMMK